MASGMCTGEQQQQTQEKLFTIISKIQETVNATFEKLNSQNEKIENLTKDIHQVGGIKQNLVSVMTESNAQSMEINEIKSQNKVLTNRVELLSSYVIRLEQKIDLMQNKIVDLTGRSMREIIIIANFPEKKGENLREDILGFLYNEIGVPQTRKVKIDILHRIGKFREGVRPRSIVIKFHDYEEREYIIDKGKSLKTKGSPIRIYPQSPEEVRDNKKRLFDLKDQYSKQNVETKIVGDRLVFKGSGQVHREKVPVPKAQDILGYTPKGSITIHTGDEISDNGNHFQARVVRVQSYADARHAVRQILQVPSVASSTHNILAYRFTDKDNEQHEGIDDDRESGASFNILKHLRERNVDNVMVVVSRKFGQKLGPKRFSHVTNAAKSALDKVN